VSAPLVFYYDQAQLGTVPTGRRCPRPRGRPVGVPHTGRVERRYLHGALCYPTGEWYFRTLPRMDAASVVAFCRALLADFPGRELWLILDGAPAHRGHQLQALLRAQPRLRLQFQPTYAPWTNPVERVWQELRRAVTHSHDLPTLEAVLAAAQRWCERFAKAPQAARRLASFQGAQLTS
jgi:putative transposase